MTVQSQVLRCMNNRLRNADETVKSTSRKPVAASFHHDPHPNTRTQQTQSEPKISITEIAFEAMHGTQQVLQSRRDGIFRQQLSNATSIDDVELEGMLMLKRANPVYDSDDEDDFHCSPLKRQKSRGCEDEGRSVSSVSWDDRLIDGFSLDSPISSGKAIGAH